MSVDEAGPGPETAQLAAEIGRLGVELEKDRFDLEMAKQVQLRQRGEIGNLERRIAVLEAERRELIDQVAHRDRLITAIQSSRSWRWAQGLRRRLGRR